MARRKRDPHQITHDMIFGNKPLLKDWWQDAVPQHATASTGAVPSYWGYRLIGDHPDGEEFAPLEVEVRHCTVEEFVERIAAGQFDGGEYPVSPATAEACRTYLDAGDAEFDRQAADEVLQVIMYGEVPFS